MPEEIKLSLLNNSHAFLDEAVSNAVTAQSDARKWQFAVLHLVQSLELSLKSLLHNIHPILIYENIDAPKYTVGPIQALDRLNNPSIADAKFGETDQRKIKAAIDLRNQMTHSDFTLKPEYAMAKFFEVFAFVAHFQAKHFRCEIENIISTEKLQALLAIEKGRNELAQRAKQRISDEAIDGEFIFECPNCQNDTFVIQDDINTCYTCRHTEEVRECRKCGNYWFDWQLHDFSGELDIDLCEGQARMVNNFGYDYFEACDECIGEIREDIQDQRMKEEWDDMERRYWEEHDPR